MELVFGRISVTVNSGVVNFVSNWGPLPPLNGAVKGIIYC